MTTDDRIGAGDSPLRRCRRAVACLRHLFDVEPFDVTKEPRDPIDVRCLVQSFIEPAQLRASFGAGVLHGERIERDLVTLAIETEQTQQATTPESAVNETHRDAMNPRAERARLAEIGEVFEGRHEGVLKDVHRVVTRGKKTRRQPKNRRRITAIQELFGCVIALARSENQASIVLRPRCLFSGKAPCASATSTRGVRQGPRERVHYPRV